MLPVFSRSGPTASPLNPRRRSAWMRYAILALIGLALFPGTTLAQATLPALTATPGPGGAQTYSLSMQTLLLMTSLTFLPAALLMMTSFTRIIIVLGFLRTAMGTQSTPPNMVLLGLALFLTFYTMSPVFNKIYTDAYKPLSNNTITFETAVDRASVPLRAFMLHQTRETDLRLFADLAKTPALNDPSQTPMGILVPAFVTSELKTAFQIGFTIFIPFLIIDMVVASTLMALGMMMVPPATVSLPFKLMLFVLADGWHLLMGSLAKSFYQ
jgi:flagellar biosynthetic protein FliP